MLTLLFFQDIILPEQPYKAEQVIYTQTRRIWDPDCSAFVKSNVAEADTAGPSPADSADPRSFDDSTGHSNGTHGLLDALASPSAGKLKAKRSRGQLNGLSRKKARR